MVCEICKTMHHDFLVIDRCVPCTIKLISELKEELAKAKQIRNREHRKAQKAYSRGYADGRRYDPEENEGYGG